ncbi:MAG: tetratricopeptide repeat protein, partial [Gammaproteobacteria bacterium]
TNFSCDTDEQLKLAKAALNKAALLIKDAPDYYYPIIINFQVLGDSQQADQYFLQAISSQSTAKLLAAYAHFLFQQQRYADCLTYCSLFLEQNKVLNEESDIIYTTKEENIVAPLIKQLIKQRYNISLSTLGLILYLQIISSLRLSVNMENHIEQFADWVLQSDKAQWYFVLSDVYEQLDEPLSAWQYYKLSEEKDNKTFPTSKVDYLSQLAKSYIMTQRNDIALITLNFAKEATASSPQFYHNLACYYHAIGEIEQAKTCFEEGIKQCLTSKILVEYAHFLYCQNEIGVCLTYCDKFWKLKNNPYYEALYYDSCDKNTVVPVIKLLMDYLGNISIESQSLASYLQGLCYLSLHEEQNLNQCLDKLQSSNGVEAIFLLADLQKQSGKLREAQLSYDQAHKLNNKIPQITVYKEQANPQVNTSISNFSTFFPPTEAGGTSEQETTNEINNTRVAKNT